jgi:hypothetical protein
MRMNPRALLAVVLSAIAPLAWSGECRSLAPLSWLLGDWLADGDKSSFRETWTAVSATTWEGRGVETSKSHASMPSAEELRLAEMSDGVYYISKVAQNELPVAFRLVECEDGRFAFVNPAHDFPRRLEYVQGSGGSLQVRVSDGADQGFTLDFRRAPPIPPAGEGVLAAEDARFAAMVKGDAQILRGWLAADLEYVHTTGEIENRERLIESITGGSKRYLAIEPLERQVVMTGADSAFVQGLADIQVMAGPKRLEFRARYLAVYDLEEGVWQLRAWQSLRLP